MNRKHALIMVICCLIPIAAFTLIAVFKVPVSGLLTIALILLCPVSHLIMMKFMPHEHEEHHAGVEARAVPKSGISNPSPRPGESTPACH